MFNVTGITVGWKYPILLWVVPGILALALLAFMFDWVPHHPHKLRMRYLDTRVILFPGLPVITINQNLHLVHHLYPRIPFYKYGDSFKDLRSTLEEKGSIIIESRRLKIKN